MRSTGSSPTANRTSATSGPDSRADASFAVKAITPKNVADIVMTMSAL